MQSGDDLQVMFEKAKASAILRAKGVVLVYAHVGKTTRGCGWYAYPKPNKTRVARLERSLKGSEFRMEELNLGQSIV